MHRCLAFVHLFLNPPGQLSADSYSMVKLGRTACFYRKTVTFKSSHHAPRVFLVKQLLWGSKPHGATSITTRRPVPLENPPCNLFQETTGFCIFQRMTGTIYSACWYEMNFFWLRKKMAAWELGHSTGFKGIKQKLSFPSQCNVVSL